MKPERSPILRLLSTLFAMMALCATGGWAQVAWTTLPETQGRSAGSCVLADAKLRVKVFPAYLEVEEEVDLRTQGTVSPSHDASSLRITADFQLPAGAVVTGALLWEGNRILQARLLDNVRGDSIYEAYLDQDSVIPYRPVDPLLLERVGANAYKLKVYPVALGASRRIRLRYQLPPRLGADGFEMRLQGAITPLFPAVSSISTSLEAAPGVTGARISEGGVVRAITLPRTIFIARDWLASSASAASAARVLPVDTLRQVQVKTSFGSGSFQGHYLNLYGSVDLATLQGLGRRIEVVAFWKWHNPMYWKNSPVYIAEAKAQGTELIALYEALGGPGNRVGLLHDDAHRPQKAFAVASRGEAEYLEAHAYLQSLQGNAINAFVDSVAAAAGPVGAPPVSQSRSRFLANMQIVKTLYSPGQGVVRHLVMISAGPEYTTSDFQANEKFDSLFGDRPVSVGSLRNRGFTQAGFDFETARYAHAIQGTEATAAQTRVPGFAPMTLYATLRNASKAYDFTIACSGGLNVACGSLEFHGKSATPWSDTVAWEAWQTDGKFLGRTKTRPTVISASNDTSIALLWAGASAPFSESKEPALGAAYGFVDASNSLLAMSGDTLPGAGSYADTGVPRAAPVAYPGPLEPEAPPANALMGGKGIAGSWRFERAGAHALHVRVPKLAAGAKVEVELIGLDGRRVAAWTVIAEAGLLRLNLSGIRAGTYLLRLRGPSFQGERLLTL